MYIYIYHGSLGIIGQASVRGMPLRALEDGMGPSFFEVIIATTMTRGFHMAGGSPIAG